MKNYTCPMHPGVISEKPGICPECGMNLIEIKSEKLKIKKLGPGQNQNQHKAHTAESFLRKFWMSLGLTIPVILYSELVERLFGFIAPEFPGSTFLPLILSSIVFFYGGWVFIIGAVRELKSRLPGMMTLIGIAVAAAYSYSVFATITGAATLFWELTTLITVMLLGHWLEMRAVQGAQGALSELSKLLPDKAEVVRASKAEIVALSELKVGDLVLVRPGAKVPADGQVVEGKSEINQAAVTGESAPVVKTEGAEVIAGTINGDGMLKVKVTRIGMATFLSGVMRLVTEAIASKSRLQILSDKAAFYLTSIAIVTGILTLFAWLTVKQDFAFAIERTVAVLVIACPHALGLAVPLVTSISTTIAAKNGFLVKQRLALETARQIDIVLFDKTGTLTKGQYEVEKIWQVATPGQKEVLKLAASVDASSEHFISRAIVGKAYEEKISLSKVNDFKRLPGKGVTGVIAGERIFVGGFPIIEDAKISIPKNLEKEIRLENERGKTIIFVLKAGKLLGALALGDSIRKESRAAVAVLKDMGVKIAMITGDSKNVAKWVAKDLGIKEYFAEVMPAAKVEKVKILQNKGYKVAMVGDGVNDAPALTQADLGVAIGAGTNVAIESAGIILVKNDPRDIVKIIGLSKATFSKMIQNLFWATGYNVAALPAAAGALAFAGILLQPALAALLMSASTVIVAVNALGLKRFEKNLIQV